MFLLTPFFQMSWIPRLFFGWVDPTFINVFPDGVDPHLAEKCRGADPTRSGRGAVAPGRAFPKKEQSRAGRPRRTGWSPAAPSSGPPAVGRSLRATRLAERPLLRRFAHSEDAVRRDALAPVAESQAARGIGLGVARAPDVRARPGAAAAASTSTWPTGSSWPGSAATSATRWSASEVAAFDENAERIGHPRCRLARRCT